MKQRIKPREHKPNLIVALGSRNPAKVQGASKAFRRLRRRVRVVGVELSGATVPQPFGLRETVKAALRRAELALERSPSAALGLGVEAGLVKCPLIPAGFMDQHVALILDRGGGVTVGGSSSFEYPSKVVVNTLGEGVEVGKVVEELSGIEGIGRKKGAIGFLSHGVVNRAQLVEQAVLMAMIPRINPELYASTLEKLN